MEHYTEEHNRRFIARLTNSPEAVHAIAEHIEAKSPGRYAIDMPELRIRPHVDVRMQYLDKYDMMVTDRPTGLFFYMEVKGRQLDFTCAADFPYPTVDFEDVQKLERGERKGYFPRWYMVCNRELTYAATVDPKKTRHLWTKRWVEGQDWPIVEGRWFYTCPKWNVDFIKLQRRNNES